MAIYRVQFICDECGEMHPMLGVFSLDDGPAVKASIGDAYRGRDMPLAIEKLHRNNYSFSPTIADWERENPIFKETVKLAITPLLTSLSILNYVDIDSEFEVLTYGISLILLNAGMYFVAPAVVIYKIRKFL